MIVLICDANDATVGNLLLFEIPWYRLMYILMPTFAYVLDKAASLQNVFFNYKIEAAILNVFDQSHSGNAKFKLLLVK